MSDGNRNDLRRSKRVKGQASRPTSAHTSGRSTPDPRLRSRHTVDPHFSNQPTPDPNTSDEPAPKRRHIATERILEPTSSGHRAPVSGQPIDTGIYTITNVHHSNVICLENSDSNESLRGHYNSENRNAQWRVKPWGNERYTIENVEHNHYAVCGPFAGLKAPVAGNRTERPWRIRARPTGEYTIAATDTGNLWMLPYEDAGTPVELFNIPTDRRCWWTFTKQETGDPANDGQSTPDQHPSTQGTLGSIGFFDISSMITEATDLIQPLRAACGALTVVAQRAEGISHVDEDGKALVNVLRIHLATVENHIIKLEEDQKIDDNTPKLDREIGELLESYARELKEIYELLFDNKPNHEVMRGRRNTGIVAEKTRAIDETFRGYIIALHRFAASTVDQMRQQLVQFGQEAIKAHTRTEGAYPSRIKRSNAYGIQHGECLQGTREKTLSAIRSWVGDERSEKRIFFFLDVAGSGKSTVAKNMAEEWKQEKRLLARFFFSRDTTETMSTSSFCSTVAGAFADLDPNFKVHLDEFMRRPNVGLLPFEEQFEGLVVGPLRAIGRHAILVIDALDECDAKQRDELLSTLHAQHSSIPLLRILATGRPERDIKRWAEEKFDFGYTNFTLLEGNNKDVELYINHRLQDLPIAQDRLYPVIQHAEGLFIWARIACDLLVDSDDIDGLLEVLGKEVSLDYLYKVALEQSMPREGASRRAMVQILQMILAAREPLSIAELEPLSPKPGVVEKVVTRLGSVLLYQGRDGPIRLLHATFREFLTAQSKADIFFIQPELGHHTLASGCLNAITHVLRQDDSALRKLDIISERKTTSFLARYLLTMYPGLSFTRQGHGSTIVQWRTGNWL